MEAYLPKVVLAGLKKTRMDDAMKKNRLRVHADDQVFPICKLWDEGFSMLVDQAHICAVSSISMTGRSIYCNVW